MEEKVTTTNALIIDNPLRDMAQEGIRAIRGVVDDARYGDLPTRRGVERFIRDEGMRGPVRLEDGTIFSVTLEGGTTKSPHTPPNETAYITLRRTNNTESYSESVSVLRTIDYADRDWQNTIRSQVKEFLKGMSVP